MTSITRLLIARHGNTFGPNDIVTRVGTTDLPLVEKGIQQAQALGEYLLHHHFVPDVIYTSKLLRTIQTAQHAQLKMHTELPIHTTSIFNEIDYGPDENQPEENVIARIGHAALLDWEANAKVPSGWRVDPEQLIHHWKTFADEILKTHAGKTILVVTSNGIARFSPYLTGNFDTFSSQHNIKISTGALCIFEKVASLEHWYCVKWNVKP